MIDVNELRKGVTFELDGNLYKVWITAITRLAAATLIFV